MKSYGSYKLEYSPIIDLLPDDPTNKHIGTSLSLKFFDIKDVWSCIRLLTKIGKKLAEETGSPTSITIYTFIPAALVFRFDVGVFTQQESEDFLHSIYLWLEHPEKYL